MKPLKWRLLEKVTKRIYLVNCLPFSYQKKRSFTNDIASNIFDGIFNSPSNIPSNVWLTVTPDNQTLTGFSKNIVLNEIQ